MDALREKMNDNRRRMGAYCMLFLRNIFPEDVSPLWGRLEMILEEGMAPKEMAGKGLWTRINDRLPAKPDTNEGTE